MIIEPTPIVSGLKSKFYKPQKVNWFALNLWFQAMFTCSFCAFFILLQLCIVSRLGDKSKMEILLISVFVIFVPWNWKHNFLSLVTDLTDFHSVLRLSQQNKFMNYGKKRWMMFSNFSLHINPNNFFQFIISEKPLGTNLNYYFSYDVYACFCMSDCLSKS